jgi:hypothetical protein
MNTSGGRRASVLFGLGAGEMKKAEYCGASIYGFYAAINIEISKAERRRFLPRLENA